MNVKGFIVDANNRLNRVFSLFSHFSSEFSYRDRLTDIFSGYFSFYFTNRKYEEGRKAYIQKLNKLIFQVSANSKITVIISNISIKNQVTTSIAYIYIYDNPIIKTLYYVVNITSTKAELFTIRCGINQAICYESRLKVLSQETTLVFE